MEGQKETVTIINSTHHENTDMDQVNNLAIQDEIAAFEERRVDMRAIMGIVAMAFTYEACIISFVLPSAVLLTINADIGPSGQINWSATGWSLASGVIQTIAGRCSDIFGRRNFALAGNAFGLIGCVVGCRANSIPTVIAGSVLLGVGAGSQLLAFACANELVPKRTRGKALAAMNAASLPGSCFGALIAYALVANLNWRWTFYVGIIANGIALILVAIFYWPPSFVGLHPEGKTRLKQFKELDFVGLLLFGGGLTIFLIGLSWGGNPYEWRSVQVLVPLLLGVLCLLVALPLWEIYCPPRIAKLCPPEIFKNFRGFVLPLVVAFAAGALLLSFQVFWPQEIQMLFTSDPLRIGYYSLAYTIPSPLGGAVAAFSFSTFRHSRFHFIAVTFLATIFSASVASVNQHTPARGIALVFFAGIFVGATALLKVLMLQFGAADRHIGVATGLMGSAHSIGGAIAIAVYSSILRNKLTSDLVPTVASAAAQAGLPPSQLEGFIGAFLSGSGSALGAIADLTPTVISAATEAARGVYSNAFKLIFLVSLAFGVPASIAASWTPSVDDKMTSHVAVKLDAPHLLGHGKGEAMALYDLEDKAAS